MTMASPALAVKVQASISPVEMVPVSVEPFIIGPPSSPAEITTGSPVLARVRRYWPVPLSAPLPSPTTTRYVPLVGADAEPTSAADAPKLDCTKVPLGLYNRTQGVNEFVSVILPTLARRASPATALNVHTSRSPVRIVPVCMTPLVIGPPSSPGETVIADPVLTSVSRYDPVRFAPLPSLIVMVKVPEAAAVTATSAAAFPALVAICVLEGLKSWIFGVNDVVPSSPTRTTIASPVFALKVQLWVPPETEIAPSVNAPGVIVAPRTRAGSSKVQRHTKVIKASPRRGLLD